MLCGWCVACFLFKSTLSFCIYILCIELYDGWRVKIMVNTTSWCRKHSTVICLPVSVDIVFECKDGAIMSTFWCEDTTCKHEERFRHLFAVCIDIILFEWFSVCFQAANLQTNQTGINSICLLNLFWEKLV